MELPADDDGLEDRARRSPPATRSCSSRRTPRRPRPTLFAELAPGVPAAGRVQRGLRRPRHRPRAGRAPDPADGVDHRLGPRRHGGRRLGGRRSSSASHLELGGKAPVVVFDDADVEAAAEGDRGGAATSTPARTAPRPPGCSPAPGVHDDFVAALTEQARNTKTGLPDDEDVLYGALNNANQLDRVTRHGRPAARPRQARDRRHAAGRAGLLLRADRRLRAAAGRRADPGRDLRPGHHRAAVHRRGARRCAGPTA